MGGDTQDLGTHNGRLAPAPGHHGGVADQSAAGGQDALGRQHPVHVLGRSLATDENDLFASFRRCGRIVGREVGPAHRRPRAGSEALGPHRITGPGELRVQHRIEMVLGDARHRLGLGYAQVVGAHHVHRHLQGGGAGALAHPGLEHPQLALVDGEFCVAHVVIMALEALENSEQFGMHLGELFLELGDGLGVAYPGHDVFALGIDQKVPVGALGAGGRVAGEAHPGAGVVVAVAEHHGLDVYRRPQIVGDPLTVAIRDGPGTIPTAEHRFDGAPELSRRVLGEGLLGVTLDDLLVGVDEITQQLGRHLGVRGGAGQFFGRVEERVEFLAGKLEHDPSVHGDETAIRVEGEALVPGLLGQPLDGAVVEAEVENGVHHAWHGEFGTGAHRNEERVIGVADHLAHGRL